MPFVSPEAQVEALDQLEESRRKATIMGRRPSQSLGPRLSRTISRKLIDMRGVLTVTVHRCLNLEVCFWV